MRVLMQPRPSILKYRGGDTTQVLETAKALRAQGLTVDISLKIEEDLSNCDVIHLFTTSPEGMAWTYPRFHVAKVAKKPIVVSTIYWPWVFDEVPFARGSIELRHQTRGVLAEMRSFVPPWIKYGVRWLITGRKSNLKYDFYRILAQDLTPQVLEKRQRQVWCSADVLLPNSEAEAQIILNAVKRPLRYVVVPNAVKAGLFEKVASEEFVKRYGVSDFVLCAGVITPRKNQLRLVRAVQDFPLVLIGETRPFAISYVEACKREAGPNAIFLEAMDQSELASAYAAAKVHVLASEFETPGISNLEAAVAGCNIVSTTGGCTQEYFGDFAWYCDPGDTQSIREAVSAAYASPYREELAQRIRNQFTWDMAAKATLKGYESALQAHNRSGSKAGDRNSRKIA